MPQPSKLIRLSLVGAIILGLFVGVLLAICGRSCKLNAKVARHSVEASPDEVLEYWKGKDLSKSRAKPLPEVPADALEKLEKQSLPRKHGSKRS